MKNVTHIGALILIFGILILSIGLNVKQYLKSETQTEQIDNLIENSGNNKVSETYVRDSVTHTVYNEKIVTNTAEKKIAIGKTYADSLERALKTSIDKIDQVTKINAVLAAKLSLKEAEPILGRKVLSHKDRNISLDYFPESDSVDLAVDIGLNQARYSKRKWILGAPQHYIDVFPDDERIKIKGLKSYTLKEKPQKRFGIGLSTGYGISAPDGILKTSPYLGIGVNYNLIEF